MRQTLQKARLEGAYKCKLYNLTVRNSLFKQTSKSEKIDGNWKFEFWRLKFKALIERLFFQSAVIVIINRSTHHRMSEGFHS